MAVFQEFEENWDVLNFKRGAGLDTGILVSPTGIKKRGLVSPRVSSGQNAYSLAIMQGLF